MTDTPESDPPPTIQPGIPPSTGETDEQEWERFDAEEQAKKFHALFSNRIFVQPDGMHLRLTFGEKVGDETVYHSSIVVPNADALAFAQLLARMAELSLENQLAFYRRAIAEVDARIAAEEGKDGQ